LSTLWESIFGFTGWADIPLLNIFAPDCQSSLQDIFAFTDYINESINLAKGGLYAPHAKKDLKKLKTEFETYPGFIAYPNWLHKFHEFVAGSYPSHGEDLRGSGN